MTAEQIANALPTETHFSTMTAELQRCVFGAKPFGRLRFRHTGNGFQVRVTVDYGRDYDIQHVSYAEVAAAIAEGRTVWFQR